MRILWIAVIAAILDLLLGDPLWMPHVVRLLGTVIGGLDRYLRSLTDRLPEEADRKQMERLCGILLCILVLGSTWVVWTVLRAVLYRISTWLGFAAECFLAYQLLAMRCLRKEHKGVPCAGCRGCGAGPAQSFHDRGPGHGSAFPGRNHPGGRGDGCGKYVRRGGGTAVFPVSGRDAPHAAVQSGEYYGFHGGLSK